MFIGLFLWWGGNGCLDFGLSIGLFRVVCLGGLGGVILYFIENTGFYVHCR